MSEPLITVLIDTYNHGALLDQAIESALAQDFPAGQVEICVVDDGSTDDTADRVNKYGSRINYLRKSNGGQASAFNYGVSKARGQIVAFLDGDDYWLPDKLRSIVMEFEKHPDAGLVYHPLREYHAKTDEFKDPIFTPVSGFLPSDPKQVLRFDWMFTSSLSFRRQCLLQMLPIPEGLRIQADGFMCVVAMILSPIVAIDRTLGIYRVHGNNLFFQSSGEPDSARLIRRIESSRQMVSGIKKWVNAHGYDIRRRDIRISIRRWELMAERDAFLLEPPGRLKFVRHLMKSYSQTSPLMTPRIRFVNYVNAIGALFVGYKKFHVLDETREKMSRWLRSGNPISSYFRRKNLHRQF